MALALECKICGGELDEPGGLFFDTPDAGYKTIKVHFCDSCTKVLMREFDRVGDAVKKDIIRLRESEAYNDEVAVRVARERGIKL